MTLFLSKGAPRAPLGPYFESKEVPGPPRGAFFETRVFISEAWSHQGPFFGAPWGRKGWVEGPGAPTNTENPNYSDYSQTPKRCSRCSGSTVFNVRKGARRSK